MKAVLMQYYSTLYSKNSSNDAGTNRCEDDNAAETLFTFNTTSGQCTSISPSIKEITGFSNTEYLSRKMSSLKKMIHPLDYSYFITKTLFYINTVRSRGKNETSGCDIKFLCCRIRHKNGFWVETNFYLLYLNNTQNTLVGLMQRAACWKHKKICTNTISSREEEILQLISNGDSSKVIAGKLNISETTVITHRKHLIQKFRVRNTAELIKKAVKLRVII